MTPTLLFYLILFFLVAEFIFEKVLDYLNNKNWSETLPAEAADFYDADKYKTSKLYHDETGRLGLISGIISFSISVLFLCLGGFQYVDELVRGLTLSPIKMALLYFGIITFASSIISLPFGIYSTFVIEEKYGFNKTTFKTFVLDMIKGTLLSAVLGGGILSLIMYVYAQMPNNFWWITWIIVSGFSLFFGMFYTTLIVPIFNKLSPLPEGELKNEISAYAFKVDFPLSEIYVIDGSKRSSKANAYFSGLGKKKTIVLYDTLIEKMSQSEIVAVLAHEVGHFKHKHVYKSMILGLIQTAILFLVFGMVCSAPALHQALGVTQGSFHIALIGFSMLYSPISMLTGLMMNIYSRKNEYEADNYAKETYDGVALANGLKTLTVENLSNLTPHPWYVFFHYSHPAVLDRLRNLRG
jgi:STE24 endopeptidase